MRQQLAAVIVALSMAGGVGTAVAAHAMTSDDPRDKPTTAPTTTKTTTPAPKKSATTPPPARRTIAPPVQPVLKPYSTFVISADAIGPITLGMTKAQALQTGYLDHDIREGACGIALLDWKPAYRPALDIGTLDDGQVVSLGVAQPGPHTASGLQIGSTYATVKAALGEGVSPVATEQGQTSLDQKQGNNWIGFRFNASPDAVTDDTPVSYIGIRIGSMSTLGEGGC